MIGIIKGNGKLEKACGFENSDDVDELGGIENLRNRVMHGNRALVHDPEMLEKHLERIERAESIVTPPDMILFKVPAHFRRQTL